MLEVHRDTTRPSASLGYVASPKLISAIRDPAVRPGVRVLSMCIYNKQSILADMRTATLVMKLLKR